MKRETECEVCGRKIGHKNTCPIYLRKFVNAQPPNIYAGEDNKPINTPHRKGRDKREETS